MPTSSAAHDGKTAVITGAARGLGKAFADALATRATHVVLIDLDEPAVQSAAADIRAGGGSADGYHCDVTNEVGMSTIVNEAAQRHGGIDILINNAGLHSEQYNRPTRELGIDKVRRLFDVNVVGVIVPTMIAHPHMVGRRGASIINIASAAAYVGGGAYGASKLAVIGLTICFARELGPDGIRVNAIAPGMIMTDTIETELTPQTRAAVEKLQFINTRGVPTDIVEAMLFLTSERARFVTGETLRITGGMGSGP